MSTIRKAILIVAISVFALVNIPMPVNGEIYQDRYVIASQTYSKVTASKYDRVYKSTKRSDRSSGQTMIDAARDWCVNRDGGKFHGPGSSTPFKCS